jgi:hypothetical protein
MGLSILFTAAIIQYSFRYGRLLLPPTPFATYLSALSFGIFGVHDWAPYCGNVMILFLLMAFVDYLLGKLAFWLKVVMLLFTLTLPFVGIAIHEFRPDIAWGLLTAMGTILMVINTFLTSNIRDKVPTIICFVLALLINPQCCQ